MANRSRSLIIKAREDKARRARLKLEALTIELDEADTDEERDAAQNAISDYYQEQEEESQRKDQLKEAKLEARRAKREAGKSGSKRARIEWADGGRDLVPGRSRGGKEFFAAAEGNLVKSNRDITKWETASPYDNVRGLKRGEIVMVIGDHYTGANDKESVDVMAGPDIVRGVPAAALRPLDG